MPEARLTVGDVEILSLNDQEATLPLSDVFPEVPAAAWAPYQERYPSGFRGDHLLAHFECYLIRSAGQTILVDTGLGGAATNPHSIEAMVSGAEGRLLAELEADGVSPGDINTVFFSHLHFDHVGWNLTHEPGRASPAHLPQRALRGTPRRLGDLPTSRGDGIVPAPLGPDPRPSSGPRRAGSAGRRARADRRNHCHPNAGAYSGFHEPRHRVRRAAGLYSGRRVSTARRRSPKPAGNSASTWTETRALPPAPPWSSGRSPRTPSWPSATTAASDAWFAPRGRRYWQLVS